jgi:hypothetical protein
MSLTEAENVTIELIKDALENAALEVKIDPEDGELYVNGLEFPCWVSLDAERNLISFRTYLKCKEGAPNDQLPKVVRTLNESKIIVTFTSTTYDDGRGYINGYYYLFHNFGLNTKNLIFSLRKFSEIFVSGIREIDEDDVFFD